MSNLSINLFGSFQVSQAGAVVSDFESDKVRALLAYLAVEVEQPHRREALAGLFWPEFSEQAARTNLRNSLAKLRNVLGDRQARPPWLHISRQTLQFNQASAYQCDVTTWTQLLESNGSTQPTVEQLQQALVLYRAPFLAGFSLTDCPDFETWLLLKREFFARQAGQALQQVTHYYQDRGEYSQALTYAHRWLSLDNLHEEAHRQVMRLLAQNGQRNEALRQYETCAQILAEALDIEPGQETSDLFKQIQAEELPLTKNNFSAIPELNHNIPQLLTPLIGREAELTALTDFLADPARRLITLVGPGGIGKTHLAMEATLAQIGLFKHGAFFVALAPVKTPNGIVAAVAEALGFQFYDQRSQQLQLFDYLRHKQMLLVLDNFEQLLTTENQAVPGAEALIFDLLQNASGLKLLVTSRSRLQIQGEQLYELYGLACPPEGHSLAASALSRTQYGAMALFEHYLQHIQPNFMLTAENIEVVGRICRLVQGMPLALQLAAPWLEILTLSEISDKIAQSFSFLHAKLHNLPERQQSMQAVFDHSWHLLSEDEQTIFSQLALCRGGFTLKAAQTIAGATLFDLLTLRKKSLLYRRADGQYEIHELIRQFAGHALQAEASLTHSAQARHADYYLTYVNQQEANLKGPDQLEVLTQLEMASDNIEQAWEWAISQKQNNYLDRAINGLGYFYELLGRFQDGEQAYRQARQALNEPNTPNERRLLAQVLGWQARFQRQLGQMLLARETAHKSFGLLEDSTLAEGDVRPELAALYLEMSQQSVTKSEVETCLNKSLNHYQALNDDWSVAQVMWLLAVRVIENSQEREQLFRESLRLFEALGDQRLIAKVTSDFGCETMLQGQHQQAERLLNQNLNIRLNLNNRMEAAHGYGGLGWGLLLAGRYNEALIATEEALTIARDYDHQPMIKLVEAMLVNIDFLAGRYAKARDLAHTNLSYFKDQDNQFKESFTLWHLGNIALAEGNYPDAETQLQQSIAIDKQAGWIDRLTDMTISYGLALCHLERLSQAQSCLQHVLQSILLSDVWFKKSMVMPFAALLSLKSNNPYRAVELYALALQNPHIANAPWYKAVVGQHITVATTDLPIAAIEDAKAKGQVRDLDETIQELTMTINFSQR